MNIGEIHVIGKNYKFMAPNCCRLQYTHNEKGEKEVIIIGMITIEELQCLPEYDKIEKIYVVDHKDKTVVAGFILQDDNLVTL